VTVEFTERSVGVPVLDWKQGADGTVEAALETTVQIDADSEGPSGNGWIDLHPNKIQLKPTFGADGHECGLEVRLLGEDGKGNPASITVDLDHVLMVARLLLAAEAQARVVYDSRGHAIPRP
jgi:hypothetical protein